MHEGGRVMNGPHEREVPAVDLPYDTLGDEAAKGVQREDGVEVGTLIGAVVGVGPGEGGGLGRDLAVRAVARGIVYVETWRVRQVDATGGDESKAALVEGLPGPDKRATGQGVRR